jgi:hypothetical protein
MVAIVRKRLGLEASLYWIVQILSVSLFDKTPILRHSKLTLPKTISPEIATK